MLKDLPGSHQLRKWVTRAQGWWFDTTRRVDTAGFVSLDALTLVGKHKQGHDYLPARPPVVRPILRNLPIRNYSEYTFVDLGSGKGRVLFLAAEYGFRKVEGVEFALELHQAAMENIRRYRHSRQRCRRIESVNLDAADYVFPRDNLVVYLFNPFGANVMEKVMSNLAASIQEHSRHVIMVFVWPELAPLADQAPWLELHSKARHHRMYSDYRIYQTVPDPRLELQSERRMAGFVLPHTALLDFELVHYVCERGHDGASLALMIS